MTTLLFHAEPSCATRVGARVGECIVVYPDDRGNGGRGARQFLYITTDMPFEECEAFWLKNGVPDDVQAASDAEWSRFQAAERQYAIDVAKHDPKDFLTAPVKPVLDEKLLVKPSDWPQRRWRLDLSLVPAVHVKACADFVTAIEAVKADADLAETAMVAASLETIGISPSAAGKLLKPDPTKVVAFEATPNDRKADALREAARVGRALVEDPVIESFAPLDPIFMDAKALRAAAVPNG